MHQGGEAIGLGTAGIAGIDSMTSTAHFKHRVQDWKACCFKHDKIWHTLSIIQYGALWVCSNTSRETCALDQLTQDDGVQSGFISGNTCPVLLLEVLFII